MFFIEDSSMEVNGTSVALSILLMYLSFLAVKILSIHRMAKEMYDDWKQKKLVKEVVAGVQVHDKDNQ